MKKLFPIILALVIYTANASDVGVSLVQSPAPYSFLELDSSYTVQVFIYNYGADTLSNIPLIFQVGNNAILADTFSGTILPGSGKSYTFSSSYTITDTTAFTGQAKTELSGDENSLNDAQIVVYNKPSGISEVPSIELSFYPNPTNGRFELIIDQKATIILFDLSGKARFAQAVNAGNNLLDPKLPAGNYLLLIQNEFGRACRTVIIQ